MSTETFTCPRCGRLSTVPSEVREGYCAVCQERTGYRTKTGRVLTDQDFEALVAEAERGYDICRMRELHREDPPPASTVEAMVVDKIVGWCPDCNGPVYARQIRTGEHMDMVCALCGVRPGSG